MRVTNTSAPNRPSRNRKRPSVRTATAGRNPEGLAAASRMARRRVHIEPNEITARIAPYEESGLDNHSLPSPAIVET
jgi:hypothetical protein